MNLSITSIDSEIFNGTLSIYPNPNTGVFNVDLINVMDGKYTISVDNLLGQKYIQKLEM